MKSHQHRLIATKSPFCLCLLFSLTLKCGKQETLRHLQWVIIAYRLSFFSLVKYIASFCPKNMCCKVFLKSTNTEWENLFDPVKVDDGDNIYLLSTSYTDIDMRKWFFLWFTLFYWSNHGMLVTRCCGTEWNKAQRDVILQAISFLVFRIITFSSSPGKGNLSRQDQARVTFFVWVRREQSFSTCPGEGNFFWLD